MGMDGVAQMVDGEALPGEVETTMGVVEEEEGVVVVDEVDTQVGLQGHTEGVAEVEAHTTMIGKEMVAIHPTGVQKTKMETAAGEVSQVPKCRIPLAVNRFLVAGAPVEVGLVAVVGPPVVVGAMQVMMVEDSVLDQRAILKVGVMMAAAAAAVETLEIVQVEKHLPLLVCHSSPPSSPLGFLLIVALRALQ